jgi:multidrug efflux pump subunit AcrB
MKSLIRWSIQNTPAMNTLMVTIMVVGAVSLYMMRREVFPEFDLEIVMVSVPYPGASPAEVEEGICQKIEEAVRSIDHIKNLNAVAREGAGFVVLELESDVPDVQKTLNEVRSEVDRIPSFPVLAEDPEIKQITLRGPAIRVGVIAPDEGHPDSELALRSVAEDIRDELLQLPSVSQVNLLGTPEYQIDVEISESTLREYGLTLQQVAQIIRRQNLEMPGGRMKTDAQEVLLRGKNKRLTGHEIAQIPLVTEPGGVVLTVGDLGNVRDGFVDETAISRINGKPGLVVSVEKTESEDLLAIVSEVHEFVDQVNAGKVYQLPPGYELATWADRSVMVRDRMELLGRNGLQGLILVFIVLAVFLELRLAFWVALGIPISMLGACALLFVGDQTLNMLSMFAFLMALGILVDDAIVVGENVYAHRQLGKSFITAAVDGTYEVLPSVVASITTTIIAFAPLLFVPGIMGKFIAVMPIAVISMLALSLFESAFILPCHLAHDHRHDGGVVPSVRRFRAKMPLPLRLTLGSAMLGTAVVLSFLLYPLRRLADLFTWLNKRSSALLQRFIGSVYTRLLRWSLRNADLMIASAACVLALSIGMVLGGFVPYVAFPKLDANSIEAKVVFPDGTPASVTQEAVRRIESGIRQVDRELSGPGKSLLEFVHLAVGQAIEGSNNGPVQTSGGSHVGVVAVELVDTSGRDVKSTRIINRWREVVGRIPGAESASFGAGEMGPGGTPIEFKLLADPEDMPELEAAVEECKAKLSQYPGVFDIADDSRPGKWELQLKVKDRAKAMGVPLADVAETVRAAYYGEEVMRLQRGRHEVKLMVRYPPEERYSLAGFDDIRVRTGDGSERPLTELADVELQRGYSEINRLDQMRAITITADVEESKTNADQVISELESDFVPGLLDRYPEVRVRWEGQAEQTKESIAGLIKGLAVALLCMFALLTLEFRSYLQPVMIMIIIPFGAIGAILGHFFLGLDVTLFSLFGLVALTGVVVNDSIVLIDFINSRVRSGIPLEEALVDAGQRRFRPVLLTSLTTIAGLLPLLLETSFQAQVLIPMATSICFGLMFTTVMVLVLVPTFYRVYALIAPPKLYDDEAPPPEPTGTEQPAAAERPAEVEHEPATSADSGNGEKSGQEMASPQGGHSPDPQESGNGHDADSGRTVPAADSVDR